MCWSCFSFSRWFGGSNQEEAEIELSQDREARIRSFWTQDHKCTLRGFELTRVPKFVRDLTQELNSDDVEDLVLEDNLLTTNAVNGFIEIFRNIIQINLDDNKIEDFPVELRQLNHLRILSINGNSISNIPHTFFQASNSGPDSILDHLVEFYISRNNLQEIPSDISKLRNLEVFSAMRNNLTTLPEELSQLTRLRELNVNNNHIDLKHIPEKLKVNAFRMNVHSSQSNQNNNNNTTSSTNQRLIKIWNNQSKPQEIEKGLYLGCIESAKNKDYLKSIRVTHILTLNKNTHKFYPNDFTYNHVDIEDSADANLIEHFESSISLIDKVIASNGGILVHCAAGVSRSATICIAYVMKKHSMNYDAAFQYVANSRPCISPNDGFVQQLKLFDSIGCKFEGIKYKEYIQHKINETANSEATELNLAYLQMLEIPHSLFKLANLKTLIIHSNLVEKIPEEISLLQNLETLDLSYNRLHSAIPSHLAKVSSLKTLILGHNHIPEITPEIAALVHLQELHLNHNNIIRLSEEFGSLSELKIVDLTGNELFDLPATFDQLQSLRHITLNFNKFKELPAVLKKMTEQNSALRSTFSQMTMNAIEDD